MQKVRSLRDFAQPIVEIETYFHMRHSEQAIAENHTLKDYASYNNIEPHSSIAHHIVDATNSE